MLNVQTGSGALKECSFVGAACQVLGERDPTCFVRVSLLPLHSLQAGLAFASELHTGGANTYHNAQPLGLGIEGRIFQ